MALCVLEIDIFNKYGLWRSNAYHHCHENKLSPRLPCTWYKMSRSSIILADIKQQIIMVVGEHFIECSNMAMMEVSCIYQYFHHLPRFHAIVRMPHLLVFMKTVCHFHSSILFLHSENTASVLMKVAWWWAENGAIFTTNGNIIRLALLSRRAENHSQINDIISCFYCWLECFRHGSISMLRPYSPRSTT